MFLIGWDEPGGTYDHVPPGPVPPPDPGRRAGGAVLHVPVSRCLSAAGVRFLVIRCPPGVWAFLTVGLPALPDLDGVAASRTHEVRPGWVPPIPRGRQCSSRTEGRARPAPAALPRPVLQPALAHPSCGLRFTRHQSRFTFFTRPACASPRASHPAVTGDARRGRGQVAEHGPGTTRSHQLDPPIR
jgi:hypothetical protein